jgi:DNA-binding MarR family transcriptional regulator
MRMIERETGLVLEGETACCSVTVAQCHLLMELEGMGTSSLQDLANALTLDKSTLSRTIDALVSEGLVERAIDEKNRRKVSLSLTKKGTQKCSQINELCDREYANILRHIPKERHCDVMDSIGLLAAAMAQERCKGARDCCDK